MPKHILKIMLEDRTIGVVTDLSGLEADEIAHISMELSIITERLRRQWELKMSEQKASN